MCYREIYVLKINKIINYYTAFHALFIRTLTLRARKFQEHHYLKSEPQKRSTNLRTLDFSDDFGITAGLLSGSVSMYKSRSFSYLAGKFIFL